MVGVITNRISGSHYPPACLRITPGILSNDEEGRSYSILLQYVENLRGVRLVWAIVKGQGDPKTVAVAIR
jgi:hypothetical protein